MNFSSILLSKNIDAHVSRFFVYSNTPPQTSQFLCCVLRVDNLAGLKNLPNSFCCLAKLRTNPNCSCHPSLWQPKSQPILSKLIFTKSTSSQSASIFPPCAPGVGGGGASEVERDSSALDSGACSVACRQS